MKIIKTHAYEEMAAAFQCCQIQLLDGVLRENSIDKNMRKAIVGAFTSSFGAFLDQFWFDSDCGRVFPIIGFSRSHWQNNPQELFLNEGSFSFDEYIGGDMVWFYEEHENHESPQRMGRLNLDG